MAVFQNKRDTHYRLGQKLWILVSAGIIEGKINSELILGALVSFIGEL
jgi:hypothetical protein